MKPRYNRYPTQQQQAAAYNMYAPGGNGFRPLNTTDYQRMMAPEVQEEITRDSLQALAIVEQAKAARRPEPELTPEVEQYQPHEDQRQISDVEQFALAGNAAFTVVSRKTGARFTFKVRQPKPDSPHFVSVLTGSDNDNDYSFLGSIFADGTYRHGRKSTIGQNAPSACAFAWLWDNRSNPNLDDKVEVWHEGRCCRCGRRLTVPSSIEAGIGPECAGK